MKATTKQSLGAASLLALMHALPALAQVSDATTAAPSAAAARGAEGSTPDIIVTARRIEERLQDVPISITVFNQQQLANRNVVNAQDLATFTPSLSANSNLGSANSTFAIRGFVQDPDTAPSVGVYFADVVAPRAAENQIPVGDGAGPGSFFDLQNVQILKGPQGTLFGRNTTGGAILLVPQKPTSRLEGYIEGSYGNYDMNRIQAVVNIPLSDIARLRIGVDHESRDGYLKNDAGTGPARFDGINYVAARASLVVDLTPNLETYFIGSYSRSDTTGDLPKVVACNPTQSAANFLGLLACGQLAQEQAKGAGFYTVQDQLADPRVLLTEWQLINTTTWKLADTLTAKNIVSYAELRQKYRAPIFGTNFFLAPGLPIDFDESITVPGYDSAAQWTFSEEFQLQGNSLAGKLDWQGGIFYESSQPLGLGAARSPILLSCTNPDTFTCTNPTGAGSVTYSSSLNYFRDIGVYGQASYRLTSRLKATGGFRYTWDRQTNDTSLRTYLIPTPGVGVVAFCTNPDLALPQCNVSYKQNSQAPTWLIDLDYKPTESMLFYGKYSRGYRAGGIAAAGPTQFATFKPEKVEAYEAGFKSSFHSFVSGTFDLAAFYNNFANEQVQVGFDPKPGAAVGPVSGIVNAGKSRIYGAEVSASLNLFKGFVFDSSYTYLNTRIESITAAQPPASSPYTLMPLAEPGRPLSLSPRNKLSVTGTYTLPTNDSLGTIAISANYSYSSSQVVSYPDLDSPFPDIRRLGALPPLGLLSMSLNWRSVWRSPFDIQLFCTNITGHHYYTYVSGLFPSSGLETAQVGEPRMVGARLKYHFGN